MPMLPQPDRQHPNPYLVSKARAGHHRQAAAEYRKAAAEYRARADENEAFAALCEEQAVLWDHAAKLLEPHFPTGETDAKAPAA